MTPEQKVALVEIAQETFGLNRSLAAVDLAKSTWYYYQHAKVDYAEKYAELRATLEEIALAHPEYGLPRIMVELREAYNCSVNHKVVERLLGQWDLSLLRNTRPCKPSGVQKAIQEAGEYANLVAQRTEITLFQVLYTDFTEMIYANGDRKAFLMPIIDHGSKLACGWAVGQSSNTALALQAWARAKETFQELTVSPVGMIMHHDRDPVYTGYEWTTQLLVEDRLRLSYALRGARDNPEMESFNGRFKTEGHSLFVEAQTLAELSQIVDKRMAYYNAERRHSSIGYVPPLTYIQQRRSREE